MLKESETVNTLVELNNTKKGGKEMPAKGKINASNPRELFIPVNTLIRLLQDAQEDEPPKWCHTEIQTEFKEGAKGKVVCVGDCKDKKKECKKIEMSLGKKRKIITCACDDEESDDYCNLIVLVKGDEIEDSCCIGLCPEKKKCRTRGIKVEENKIRIFCVCPEEEKKF